MKRELLLLTGVFLLLGSVFTSCRKAQTVRNDYTLFMQLPENNIRLVQLHDAEIIAQTFNPKKFLRSTTTATQPRIQSTLTGKNTIQSEVIIKDAKDIPAIYIFNLDDGYLMVSADFQLEPILGFIEKGSFAIKDTAHSASKRWLNKTLRNIEIVRKGLYDNTKKARAAWVQCLRDHVYPVNPDYKIILTQNQQVGPTDPCETDPNYISSAGSTAVGPLLSTAWGQDCSFNDALAYAGCSQTCNGIYPTGCVATAMAQLIAYWQYPTGAYSYSSMPSNYGETNVQNLMRDAGTSVSMQYGCGGSHPPSETWLPDAILTNESTAQRIRDGLVNSFGYNSSATYSIYNYADAVNYSIIMGNLDNGRPVLLGGASDWNSFWDYPEGVGHQWVCDGYMANQITYCQGNSSVTAEYLYYHMNYGEHPEFSTSADGDGWLAYDNWNMTIGSTSYNFNFFDEVNYNIYP